MGDGFRVGTEHPAVVGAVAALSAAGSLRAISLYRQQAKEKTKFWSEAAEADALGSASKRLLSLVNGVVAMDQEPRVQPNPFEKVFPREQINERLTELNAGQVERLGEEIFAYCSGLKKTDGEQFSILSSYRGMITGRSWDWDLVRGDNRLMVELLFEMPRLMQVVTGIGPYEAERMSETQAGSLVNKYLARRLVESHARASTAQVLAKEAHRSGKIQLGWATLGGALSLWMLADLASAEYFDGRDLAQVLNDEEK